MAVSKKADMQRPTEIELLLPWHAAGALNPRDARKVEEALARDPELARQYALVRAEQAGIIDLNDSSETPSVGAMQRLFAWIDAEPVRRSAASQNTVVRFDNFFSGLPLGTIAVETPVQAGLQIDMGMDIKTC